LLPVLPGTCGGPVGELAVDRQFCVGRGRGVERPHLGDFRRNGFNQDQACLVVEAVYPPMAEVLAGKLPLGDIKGHRPAGRRDNVRAVGGQPQAGFFQQSAVSHMHISIPFGGRSVFKNRQALVNVPVVSLDSEDGLYLPIPDDFSRHGRVFQHLGVEPGFETPQQVFIDGQHELYPQQLLGCG
jgi:hypothetical protein